MESGSLIFSSAAPCRAAGAGGGQMMLFGGSGSILGGSPVVAGVEDGRRKRPFLTTLDEELQLEEDMHGYYLDEQAPERKRRLTAEQVVALERSFEEEKRKLDPERKSELARRLGMAPRQVAVWFQNRRARWKAKQLEHDFHALRAAHDELLAGRDALLADNHRLRSQVTSLTEKLQTKKSSPDVQTAAPSTALAGSAGATLLIQLNEGYAACAETKACNGAAGLLAAGFAGEANDSPESYSYFADARSPPSSSSDDCAGAVRGELGGCALFLPDAMLSAAAVERESIEREEEAQALNYWAWFWS